jgi:hypothetical protein
MKYYTPELLAHFGSEDLNVAKTARQELEQKADQYVSHLELIRPKLPPRLAELQGQFYLHDARVMGPVFPWHHPDFMMKPLYGPWWDLPLEVPEFEMDPGRLSSFVLVLQLDPPPQEFLVLHYRLVVLDEVSHHRRLREERWSPLEWLHDEVDLIPSDDHFEFEHSILFTQGLELRLHFRDFDYATLSPLELPNELKEGGLGKRRP